jgi:hypothetical protein
VKHWIEKFFTPLEIQSMRVIRKADEVAEVVNKTIKDELRNS